MGNAVKLTAILASALLLVLLFGCTAVGIGAQSDQQILLSMSKLQSKYFVKDNFSTSTAAMNDYISDLAELRAKSGPVAAKIIDAELYSAQTFYYLNKALAASAAINYQSIKCSSGEVKETMSEIKLAEASAAKAIPALNALNETQKQSLRPNQLETVQNYSATIDQIMQFFDGKC